MKLNKIDDTKLKNIFPSSKILGKCSKLYVFFIENIRKTVESKKYISKKKKDMSNIF